MQQKRKETFLLPNGILQCSMKFAIINYTSGVWGCPHNSNFVDYLFYKGVHKKGTGSIFVPFQNTKHVFC